jgi:hypothetical protein
MLNCVPNITAKDNKSSQNNQWCSRAGKHEQINVFRPVSEQIFIPK